MHCTVGLGCAFFSFLRIIYDHLNGERLDAIRCDTMRISLFFLAKWCLSFWMYRVWRSGCSNPICLLACLYTLLEFGWVFLLHSYSLRKEGWQLNKVATWIHLRPLRIPFVWVFELVAYWILTFGLKVEEILGLSISHGLVFFCL